MPKRSERETKRLRTYLGRVMRDIRRKRPTPEGRLGNLLMTAERIFRQSREDSNKVYSVHAPEVECIAKGKAHKKYEFGCKVPVVTTSRRNWVVGIDTLHGNPFDGHTLKRRAAIEPIIGHLKSDNRMDRNHLKGKDGDRTNAILLPDADSI